MPELERALRELGRELDWPRERDLAPAVAARLGAPGRRRDRRPLALAFAALALVAAAALAVPPARSAILDFLRIGGVAVERVETLPDLPAARVAPGRPVTLEEARAAVDFPLAVPTGYEAITLAGQMVTFVWPDRLLSQLPGHELVLRKALAGETEVAFVSVGGAEGVWIEGALHGVELPGGARRLAGNVLVWTRGGTTFRLEGDLTRAEALALAEPLAP